MSPDPTTAAARPLHGDEPPVASAEHAGVPVRAGRAQLARVRRAGDAREPAAGPLRHALVAAAVAVWAAFVYAAYLIAIR